MRRLSIRQISIGTAVALVAGIAASVALAAPGGHGRFGPIGALHGPGAGGPGELGGLLAGPGGGVFGFGRVSGGPGRAFGFGIGRPGLGPRGHGPGGGILGADVLTPAAAFINISVADLAADLKGGKTLAEEAKAKGKTADDLISAIVAAEKKVLDAEVSAGWLTSDQATTLLTGLKSQITSLVNAGPPVPATRPGGLLENAAAYLGLSAADLRTALKGGKTLAEVTSGVSGKTVDGLVAAVLAPAKKQLDAAVADGKITQSQETTIVTNLTSRLTDLANGKAGPGQGSMTTKSLGKHASLQIF